MGSRKIPLRLCLTCRDRKPKRELVRLVRTVDGPVVVDPSGKVPGRGAYLCKNQQCLDNLTQACLAKALDASISEELLTTLRKDIEEL